MTGNGAVKPDVLHLPVSRQMARRMLRLVSLDNLVAEFERREGDMALDRFMAALSNTLLANEVKLRNGIVVWSKKSITAGNLSIDPDIRMATWRGIVYGPLRVRIIQFLLALAHAHPRMLLPIQIASMMEKTLSSRYGSVMERDDPVQLVRVLAHELNRDIMLDIMRRSNTRTGHAYGLNVEE